MIEQTTAGNGVMLRGQLQLGRAELVKTAEESKRTRCGELMALINQRIKPPILLRSEDVHIRSLRLISDEVNDHGGRFPVEEYGPLCALLIDTPVLIGHDRTRLPVARNFDARPAVQGRSWIEVSFYWLRSPHGDRLAADIDSGIVKEGSIGFEFRLPRCSVCGQDIRTCDHIPGHEYADATGQSQSAHYEYRQITRVLETSLVYRGATPGTHFAAPVFCKSDSPRAPQCGTHAVVLDRSSTGDGKFDYLLALRDNADPAVCDELTIHSCELFAVGERLTEQKGSWRRADHFESADAAQGEQTIGIAAGLMWAMYTTVGRREVTGRWPMHRAACRSGSERIEPGRLITRLYQT